MTTTTTQHSPAKTAAASPATASVPADPGAVGAGWTVFEGPAGPSDADTHEGLRLALGVIERDGWESPAGRAVIAALRDRCATWASRRIIDSHIGSGDLDPGEVLSVAWCTLATFTAHVVAAEAPWAYLWTSVHNTLAVEIAAGRVLSRLAVLRGRATWPPTAVRLGIGLDEDGPDLDDAHPVDDADRFGGQGVSPSVAALIGHLAGGDAAEEVFWTDAVTRALDVMDGARLTYEHAALRSDPYLRQVLGLAPDELSALGALLVGPRSRGDRAAQCLLLALRADPAADPATVPGALARIRLVTARRPAPAAAGLPTAVVVAA